MNTIEDLLKRIETGKEIGVRRCCTKMEGIVDAADVFRALHLPFPRLYARRLRDAVWHVEHSRYATSCGSTALALDVGFVRKSWLAEMNVLVNDTRKQVQVRVCRLRIGVLLNACYLPVLNTNGADELPALVYYRHVFYPDRRHFSLFRFYLTCQGCPAQTHNTEQGF